MRTRTKPLKLHRFMTFFILVVAAFAVLVGRFFQIQVLEGKEYARKFKNQCWQNESIRAYRGTIYDRNGIPLAYTMESENIYASSDSVPILKDIALRAAPVLDVSQGKLYKKLTSNGGGRISLAKKIDPVTSGKLRSMDIPGIEYEIEYDRVYPYGHSVAALLGYLDHEYKAKAGIESYCDEFLGGRDGLRSYIRDASGKKYPILYEPDIPPIDGNDVYLTIDIEYQQILQEEIEKAVDKWSALGGMGVLMEVASGKILAVYHYDPSQTESDCRLPKERAITDLFEPGSTFKAIVFAALLEERLIDLDDTIYAGEGKFKFNGITVHDDKELEYITQAEAYVLSSNIATGRLALRLGPKKLFRYARDFGFGLSSGLDFPGEVNGRLNEPEVWSEYYCAMLSIGHEVAVNSVQIAGVFGCLANHGRLMKPLLVERVISPTGGTIKRFYPEEIRSVFSDSTVAVMQDLCAQVVDTGTAKYAKLKGITFAGKTGTAEKPSANGGYDKSKYIASFGGYFPRENPQICGLIMIDEPKKIHYGGITAAPAFAMTAKRIINLQNHKKDFAGDVSYAAREIFRTTDSTPGNMPYREYSQEVNTQTPPVGNAVIPIKATTIGEHADSALIFLPDLSGKSARSAAATLLGMGLECSLEGMGNVVRSVPEGGSFARPGEHVKLICSLTEKEVGY